MNSLVVSQIQHFQFGEQVDGLRNLNQVVAAEGKDAQRRILPEL